MPSILSALRVAILFATAAPLVAGCTSESTTTDDEATSESNVELTPAVVVADSSASNVAETLADSIRLPLAGGASQRYAALPSGTIFVGARAAASVSKNPDGFLRRVVSTRTEGDAIVIMTTPAVLTDAIVAGSVRASSSGGSIDGSELRAAKDFKIDLDFSDQPLFENVDEIETPEGKTRFTESVKFEHAKLFARPTAGIDLHIRGGKVGRFTSKIEGHLDASVTARAEVTAEGEVSDAAIAGLREKHHEVRRVIYHSDRIALPTFSVGRVPVSPAVQFTVSIHCNITFGGPLLARAGIETKSYVRLAAVHENGVWAPPVKSDFDIKPSFTIERGSQAEAHCALETNAELSAYGTTGITMTVAPYVDFGISPRLAPSAGSETIKYGPSLVEWSAAAGATGSMHGRADVFGLAAVDQALVEWKAAPLTGALP